MTDCSTIGLFRSLGYVACEQTEKSGEKERRRRRRREGEAKTERNEKKTSR